MGAVTPKTNKQTNLLYGKSQIQINSIQIQIPPAYQGFPQFHQTRMGITTDISSPLLPSILFLIHYTLPLYVIYQGVGIVQNSNDQQHKCRHTSNDHSLHNTFETRRSVNSVNRYEKSNARVTCCLRALK